MTHKTFIAAPFGNYIKPDGAISVTGTWTLAPRGNRVWSILKSLRYNKEAGGWTNKLGLPNRGIHVGLRKTLPSEVLSIAEVNKGDFLELNRIIPQDQNIELNLSCPNLGYQLPWETAKVFKKSKRKWCIAKLSPLTTLEELKFVIDDLGFKQVHFSNTLPIGDAGGISGPVLKHFTLRLLEQCIKGWGKTVEIIAGGGVRDLSSASDYLGWDADHLSIGSVCFNPFKLKKLLKELL